MQSSPTSISERVAVETLLPFGIAAAILYVVTHYLIPFLSTTSGQEPIIFWFLVAGTFVFMPMLIAACFFLYRESAWTTNSTLSQIGALWQGRLRFRKLTRTDWLWVMGGMMSIGVLSTVISSGVRVFLPETHLQPDFMALKPLTADRYWLLGLWLPFWVLNIMGEEILWRGVLLPAQEQALGKTAWLLNSCAWAIFHVAFGGVLLLTLLPILVILPYIVQKRQNSWIGVIIHAGLNGPGFVAVAFGLV